MLCNIPTSGPAFRSPSSTAAAGHAGDAAVLRALQQRLATLPFPAFARHCCDLLACFGYEDAQPAAGRSAARSKNRDGGVDLVAVLPGGVAPRRVVVVQLKQYAPGRTVHQRFVDEVRGAALRHGASEALLITTAEFSGLAEDNARAGQRIGVASVRLVSGVQFASESAARGLGVRRDPTTGRAAIDETYFAALLALVPARPAGKGSGGMPPRVRTVPAAPAPCPPVRSVTVTVAFGPAPEDIKRAGTAALPYRS